MNLDLSKFFITQTQSREFAAKLSELAEKVYQTNFDLERALTDEFGVAKKDRFMKILREQKINLKDNAAVKEFFNKLVSYIASLPILAITVAITPNETLLESIAEWLQINVKKQFLLQVKIDHSLIAGATIFFNGRMIDCSVKGKFDTILVTALQQSASQAQKVPANHQAIETITIGR